MTGNRTGNNRFLKAYNEAVILDLIRINRSISKAELSQITGLSPTAIGVITSSLMEKGYIHETGTGESRGGRKPVLLELKPGAFYSIGIDLDLNYINLVLLDMSGMVVSNASDRMPHPPAVDKAVEKIGNAIQKMLAKLSIGFDRLLGIGISVAGFVDSETKKIILAPNLGWENVDIREHLSRFSRVPVYVENEAMASAIYESWMGSCQDIADFVCINLESGIGAGIFIDGRPYRGANGSAGEVGHIVVDENGPKCGCGNYGCLETVASPASMVEKAKRLVKQGVVSVLNNAEDVENIDLNLVIQAAREGDETAKGILLESARYIGIAISSIVNTLNPSKIVIGKEFTRYADLVLGQIKSITACKALNYPASRVDIAASDSGENSSTIGAGIIPLKILFGR